MVPMPTGEARPRRGQERAVRRETEDLKPESSPESLKVEST